LAERIVILLHIKSVTCIKQERCLFADLNFSLNSGQIMQLAGANGAGKTSLLNILSGGIDEYEGDVIIPKANRVGVLGQNQFEIGRASCRERG